MNAEWLTWGLIALGCVPWLVSRHEQPRHWNGRKVVVLLYLALRNISKEWTMPPREWKAAMSQFAILFGDRFQRAGV